MNQNLADLFEKKSKTAGSGVPINWDERRDKYLGAVRDLYCEIETILAEPIKQNKVSLHRRPKQLTENYIGTYMADDLILIVGDEQVRFSPRGRNIAGAAGRVDVVGDRAEATMLLQTDSGWGFVQTRQPTLQIEPLTESTLADILKLVMRN